jgi:uncharacterized protein HemY
MDNTSTQNKFNHQFDPFDDMDYPLTAAQLAEMRRNYRAINKHLQAVQEQKIDDMVHKGILTTKPLKR